MADTASSFTVGARITAGLLLQGLSVDSTRIHIEVRRDISPATQSITIDAIGMINL